MFVVDVIQRLQLQLQGRTPLYLWHWSEALHLGSLTTARSPSLLCPDPVQFTWLLSFRQENGPTTGQGLLGTILLLAVKVSTSS